MEMELGDTGSPENGAMPDVECMIDGLSRNKRKFPRPSLRSRQGAFVGVQVSLWIQCQNLSELDIGERHVAHRLENGWLTLTPTGRRGHFCTGLNYKACPGKLPGKLLDKGKGQRNLSRNRRDARDVQHVQKGDLVLVRHSVEPMNNQLAVPGKDAQQRLRQ